MKGINERECVLSGKPIASNETAAANGYGYPTKDDVQYRQNGQISSDDGPVCRRGGGG